MNPPVGGESGKAPSSGRPTPGWEAEHVLHPQSPSSAGRWVRSGVGIVAITAAVVVPSLGASLMLFMAGGPWRPIALLLLASAAAPTVYLAVAGLRPPVQEERLRVGAEGLEHVEIRARGRDQVRRLPWATLISVRLDDAGEQVLVRTPSAEIAVARLGSREQRAAITASLRDRLRRDGAAIPPRWPPGWVVRRPDPRPLGPRGRAVQDRAGTVVHRGPRRVLATTVQGLVVAGLLGLPAPALLSSLSTSRQVEPLGDYLLVVAVLGGSWLVYQVMWGRNRAPAFEVAPGRLTVGVIHPRRGTWRRPPQRVVGLHLSGGGDTPTTYRLDAVLASGRHVIIDSRSGDDALREVAAWLSEVTGVEVEDAVVDDVRDDDA